MYAGGNGQLDLESDSASECKEPLSIGVVEFMSMNLPFVTPGGSFLRKANQKWFRNT
jgi:hypothetical protein